LNLFYQKFLKKSNRFFPLLAVDGGGFCLAEKFSSHFLFFARARFFLLRRQGNFSARLPRQKRGASLRLGHGGIPPRLPFRRALA